MPVIKAFLETTIFNRYFEEPREYARDSKLLFDKIQDKQIIGYTSAYVIDELVKSNSPKKEQMLELLSTYSIVILKKSQEIFDFADVYIVAGIIPVRFKFDAIHIATATLHNLDCIISLNFHHINKLKVKHALEAVNKFYGYDAPIICTPSEVVYD